MRLFSLSVLLVIIVSLAPQRIALAVQVKAPTVFLDKSPRIVAYQLGRLDDERLLMVPRSTEDKKYIPVYEAIVSRPAMAAGIRNEALEALAKLKDSSVAKEIFAAIGKTQPKDAESRRLISVLTGLLVRRPTEELVGMRQQLEAAASAPDGDLRSTAFAGLVVAGSGDSARSLAKSSEDGQIAFLRGIRHLPDPSLQADQRGFVVECLEEADSADGKRAAIEALSRIPADQANSSRRLFALVDEPAFRFSACRGLLRLPADVYAADDCRQAALSLVAFAENTAAAKRTTDDFIDAMQLVDRLMANVPAPLARELRGRLREVTVRVVKIGTVEEEMRYDVPYFAVEAGRPVQILLENHDLMPHNLVITQPGALKAVALAGQAAGPRGANGLPYVPDSPNVLAATEMVAPDQSARITLNAPSEPGEYPYVCTFPQHWYRMYGVMVVVEDLDAWNQNPAQPANPIGSNRSFVQAWTLDDFQGAFANDLRGRSPVIGEKIFNEASCVGCHKINEVGGAVGPELTDVYSKWKSDHMGILREILVPSHKIDSKYAMQTILTADGETLSGIVVNENDDTLALLTNPEAKEPMIILQDDIELIKRSATSMMPKALMDQYTKDEILELMAYLQSLSTQTP